MKARQQVCDCRNLREGRSSGLKPVPLKSFCKIQTCRKAFVRRPARGAWSHSLQLCVLTLPRGRVCTGGSPSFPSAAICNPLFTPSSALSGRFWALSAGTLWSRGNPGWAYRCGSHSLLTAGDSAGASSVRVMTAGLSALPGGAVTFQEQSLVLNASKLGKWPVYKENTNVCC